MKKDISQYNFLFLAGTKSDAICLCNIYNIKLSLISKYLGNIYLILSESICCLYGNMSQILHK